jgi:hypothetical protein
MPLLALPLLDVERPQLRVRASLLQLRSNLWVRHAAAVLDAAVLDLPSQRSERSLVIDLLEYTLEPAGVIFGLV